MSALQQLSFQRIKNKIWRG